MFLKQRLQDLRYHLIALLKERDLPRNPRRTRKYVLLISAKLHSNDRRDCHDPNNLIQASFTKTMFALGKAAKQLHVEAQRLQLTMFIQSEQIHISANAAGMRSLEMTAKVGLTA